MNTRWAAHVARMVGKEIHKNLQYEKLKESKPLKYLGLDGGGG